MTYDKLLYGKDQTERVVSIEPDGELSEIFTQNPDGTVNSTFVKNKYWLLAHEKLDKHFVRLKGDLHFKWGRQFTDRTEYSKSKNIYRSKDTYSIYDPKESFMVNKGYTYFKGLNVEDVSILSFDLETTGLDPNLPDAKILLISNTFKFKDKVVRRLFAYDEHETQGAMLEEWCKWVKEMDPSIMLGHNIFGFDLRYIKGIADKENVQLVLGRNDSNIEFNSYVSKFRKEASMFIEYNKCHVYGRELIDTMFLTIKWDSVNRQLESHALKKVMKQLGLEKEGRVFYDASLIRVNYKDPIEFSKIKEYCKDDSDDSLLLYEKMIPPFFYSARNIPKSFTDIMNSASGSQINSMMVRAYLQDGHSVSKADEVKQYQGGVSFGIPGVYKNCWKLDIKSCYPSAILINKLYEKNKDPEAYFYKLCEFFTNERFSYKKLVKETGKQEYKDLDQTAKLFINSLYGFCSAQGLNYNAPEIAALITEYGRNYLNEGVVWATGKELSFWKGLVNE